jgi:sigma-E factor negative regulatory protein RseC
MTEIGVVKESSENKAVIVIARHSACKKCGVCKIGADEKTVIAQASNFIGAKAGDKVEVELSFKTLMSASFIIYVIPLVMFFIGCVIGFYFITIQSLGSNNPVVSFTAGCVFLIATYLIIRRVDKAGKFKNKYNMNIVKIINED